MLNDTDIALYEFAITFYIALERFKQGILDPKVALLDPSPGIRHAAQKWLCKEDY